MAVLDAMDTLGSSTAWGAWARWASLIFGAAFAGSEITTPVIIGWSKRLVKHGEAIGVSAAPGLGAVRSSGVGIRNYGRNFFLQGVYYD